MVIAFLFAAGSNLFAYWNSDKMVLRMYGAQPVDETRAPDLVHIVRQLAERAGLPMPKVYHRRQSDQPNAFATGRNPEHAAVCVTTGLLHHVNAEELAGVLAHELSHIKHRDTLTMTITATLAGAISMLANFAMFAGMFGGGNNRNNPFGFVGIILMSILAPMAAVIVQMAISRTREFEADREGAEISGRPLWLASALKRIEAGADEIGNDAADAHPATAHMFIINPLHGGFSGLFASHPSTAERVARLQAMAEKMGQAAPRAGPLGVSAAPAGLAAREAAQAILGEVLRKRRPLDAALDLVLAKMRTAAARCRFRARHRRRDPAPIWSARRRDPRLRAQAAAAAQGRAGARDPADRRVRASVPQRRRTCRRRCRQSSGASATPRPNTSSR